MDDITENFSLHEFACQDGTPYPQEWITDRLRVICAGLEVVREAWGGPLRVISGFRTVEYNEARRRQSAGVAKNSQHIYGRAADVAPLFATPSEVDRLHRLTLSLYRDGKLPMLGGLGIYPGWIHFDIRPNTGHLAQWIGT
jgi:uncharacterized protein YcbK (DUF882 family)